MIDYVEERDGGLYLEGTRISLDSIVHRFQGGASPESILRSFPMAGTLERIYGAHYFTWPIGNRSTRRSGPQGRGRSV